MHWATPQEHRAMGQARRKQVSRPQHAFFNPKARAISATAQLDRSTRGHARSGDPQAIAGYIGNGEIFSDAIARFGAGYADQTERDWEQLKKSGRAKSNA